MIFQRAGALVQALTSSVSPRSPMNHHLPSPSLSISPPDCPPASHASSFLVKTVHCLPSGAGVLLCECVGVSVGGCGWVRHRACVCALLLCRADFTRRGCPTLDLRRRAKQAQPRAAQYKCSPSLSLSLSPSLPARPPLSNILSIYLSSYPSRSRALDLVSH